MSHFGASSEEKERREPESRMGEMIKWKMGRGKKGLPGAEGV